MKSRPFAIAALLGAALAVAFLLSRDTHRPSPTACPVEHRISAASELELCPRAGRYEGVFSLGTLFNALDGVEVCDAQMEDGRLRLAVVGSLDLSEEEPGTLTPLFVEVHEVSAMAALRDLKGGLEAKVLSPLDLILEDGAFLIGSVVEDDDQLTVMVDQANMTRSRRGGVLQFRASRGCAVDHEGTPLTPTIARRILAQREKELDL